MKLREELVLARRLGRPFIRADVESVFAMLEDFFARLDRMQSLSRALSGEYQSLLRVLFAHPIQEIVDDAEPTGTD